MASNDDVVTVHSYSTRAEAELAKSILEANGVRAMVAGDDAGGMEPWLGLSEGIHVLVPHESVESARQLLDLGDGATP